MKKCPKCKCIKKLDDFYKTKTKYPSAYCKECNFIVSKEWDKKNPEKAKARRAKYYRKLYKEKKAFINDYKRGHPCVKCGHSDYRCLQFHHLNGRKEDDKTVPNMSYYSYDRMKEEIAKCEILCANCHSIVTWHSHT